LPSVIKTAFEWEKLRCKIAKMSKNVFETVISAEHSTSDHTRVARGSTGSAIVESLERYSRPKLLNPMDCADGKKRQAP
jgi:hypothetical protein